MAEADLDLALEIGAHWRDLVLGWTQRTGLSPEDQRSAISVRVDQPATGRELTMRFTTTSSTRLFVSFMSDGRSLRRDELAVAAAAANAWNTEQLVPMLSVWDVRGPQPCLAGVCVLPLGSRLTRAEFESLADDWRRRATLMFARCHEAFNL